MRESYGRARHLGAGAAGFALSFLILGAASLLAIPAMISASGQASWGVIALGQSVGTIGGVAIGYGWGWFGPSLVAHGTATSRKKEYLESLAAKSILVVPVTAAACSLAVVLAPEMPLFAAVGAIYGASGGLDARWYFIGRAKPYTMIALDALPRLAGTFVGILLMQNGSSAVAGLFGMLGGALLALLMSTAWILRDVTQDGAEKARLRKPWVLLAMHRHGVVSSLLASTYRAAPIAIVSIVSPGIQPVFALADKIREQFVIASSPGVNVLQSWVSRGAGSVRARRAKASLWSALILVSISSVCVLALPPVFVRWLGSGQIQLSSSTNVLLGACVAVTVFQGVLERVVLATYRLLRATSLALAGGCAVGFTSVAAGSQIFGVNGALAGVLAGASISVVIELAAYIRLRRHCRSN